MNIFDEFNLKWFDDKENNVYLLKDADEEREYLSDNAFLVKLEANTEKKVWKKAKWLVYLNHDFLAQMIFPTDGNMTRIQLMMIVIESNDLYVAKKEIEEQIEYSFRKKNITFHKTRQQKIDEHLD